MTLMNQEKQQLRKIFKEKRSVLTSKEVAEKSSQISNNFIKNLLPKIYEKNFDKVFAIYLSSHQEVCTSEIIKYFIQNKIKFSYPKITQINHPLDFVLFKENQKFSENKFFPKVLEPVNGKIVIPDIVILPLLAFDSRLSRLGMGGGFFDRTIEVLRNQSSKIIIGLAYDFQGLHSLLPTEKTDQRLDFIVTETNIIS
jgi:5-formyltetrahydrofolate cyclo-ligase